MSRHYTGAVSNIFGKFASKEFHPKIQKIINNSYVKLMKLDMSNFKAPSEYSSLNALFTRELMKEPRFATTDDAIISPCDGLVTECAIVTDGHAYQIKGMEYEIAQLLTSRYSENISSLEAGEYINLYLSPKDYHRYHIPFDLQILSLTHIPGKLYPVNMPLLRKKINLFIENERVVVECEDVKGRIHFIVLVGALNVGKMIVTFENGVYSNKGGSKKSHFKYDRPIALKQSQMFGWFEMGSTILMFSPKNAVKYSVKTGAKVSYAEQIGVLL